MEYTRDSLKAFKAQHELRQKQSKNTGGGTQGGDTFGGGFGFGGDGDKQVLDPRFDIFT